jgi:hypothetical protein
MTNAAATAPFREGQPVWVHIPQGVSTRNPQGTGYTAFAGIVVRKMPATRGHSGRGWQVRNSVTDQVWVVSPEHMRDDS